LNVADLPLKGRKILQKMKEFNGSVTFFLLLFRVILIATAERISIIFHIDVLHLKYQDNASLVLSGYT